MRWKLVIFDLDGTLVDTIADLGTAVNYALAGHNLPVHPIPEYKQMVGHGIRNLVQRAMPESLRQDSALHAGLLESFLEYYTAHITDFSRPYEGIPQLLGALHKSGVKIALASNKFQEGSETLVKTFFPDIPFCAIFGGGSGYPLKPDPEVAFRIMKIAGVGSAGTVIVGDSGTDLGTAANAGIDGIGVKWGFRPAEAAQAALVADSVSALAALLLGD